MPLHPSSEKKVLWLCDFEALCLIILNSVSALESTSQPLERILDNSHEYALHMKVT